MPDAATTRPKPRVFRAAIVMCGTIIGAGIFALPAVVADAGYLVGLFWMVILAGAVALQHILFGEIAAATPEDHRLVGYVGMYLGPVAKAVENVSSLLGLVGGCIVYLILSGLFLQQALVPIAAIGTQPGAILMGLLGVAAAVYGAKFIAGVDSWMSWAEFGAFLLLSILAFKGMNGAHLAHADLSKAFLPYGLVLFSFGGLSAVNEVKDVVGGDRKAMRRAILWGSLAASGVTMLFVTAVVGATGAATTSEAIAGLSGRFGGIVPIVGAITGFLAIATTYVVFTDYLKGQLHKDYHWPKNLSILLAVGVPFGLYLAGIRNFGRVLELIGSVLAGVEGIFVILMYRIVRKKFPDATLRIPEWPLWVLAALYVAGAVYELVFRLFR